MNVNEILLTCTHTKRDTHLINKCRKERENLGEERKKEVVKGCNSILIKNTLKKKITYI